MMVTNSAPAKLFKDSWVQIRDAFRVLVLFTTTHSKEKYEDEIAELDDQLDEANLMAQCTICLAKVAEFCGARACARPLKPEQVHDLGPWVPRARPRGARASDDAIDGVNSGVVRGNTRRALHRN